MKQFQQYVLKLERIVGTLSSKTTISKEIDFRPILDGQPHEVLKSSISIGKRRKTGAFFTHKLLAEALVVPIKNKISTGARSEILLRKQFVSGEN